MDANNFWQDVFLAFQLSPDWIKALSLTIPLVVALSVAALAMRRGGRHPSGAGPSARTVYTIRRDRRGQAHIVTHDPDGEGGATQVYLGPADDAADR